MSNNNGEIKNFNSYDNNKDLLSPKYNNKIENNNIIYNNNIYLSGNIDKNFNKKNIPFNSYINIPKLLSKNTSERKVSKAKSLIDFYKQRNKKKIYRNEEFTSSVFYTKINYSLTNNTFCYYREIISEKKNKFNPLENISPKIICEPPYNYIPCTISFNNTFSKFKIINQGNDSEIIISINEIKNTIVSSLIKLVVEIYRKFKRIKGNENDKKNIIDYFLEKFSEDEKVNYSNLTREEIKKCALNNYYDFSILIKNGKKFEFVLTSYEDFKSWINGFSFIIKNKNKIMSTIDNNIK